ncbi:hypothetical protein HMPREF3293_01066 [Christensenella minuta]|uniref:Uncharacterized protein n=1 Tax=Christensenella minuta TaxID=626937 RepID=A0A136Q6S7_9FIRM|nr:hypothetical protein HMPREF3293_01066 [Christensenella minuta]
MTWMERRLCFWRPCGNLFLFTGITAHCIGSSWKRNGSIRMIIAKRLEKMIENYA